MSAQDKPGIMRQIKGQMLKRMHSMITCREFENFVMDYLDSSLPDKQRTRFEWHLRLCRECREYLAAYQRTMELGKATLGSANDTVPDEVPEDLIQAVLNARQR